MTRQLHLNLFLMSRGHHEGAWRHPGANPKSLTDLELYADAARVAEAAKFDAVFLADTLVGPEGGLQATSGLLDPLLLLTALALRTERIGLIGTASTTYNHAYTLARQFASLDHLSKGRAGWNIVTSWAPRAGQNYGLAESVDHGSRYQIAEEFVAAVDALWRSFPAAALIDDRAGGRFLDTTHIQPVHFEGRHVRTRGPLNVPGSPQGRPVYVQAGQSEAGRAFAARWAEAIFTAHGTRASAQAFYQDIKGQAGKLGRAPQDIVILPGISAAIGSTEQEAQQVWEELDALTSIDTGLARLSARFGGHDFSALPLDRKLRAEDFPDPTQVEASRSRAAGYVETSLREGLTLRQLLKRLAGARGHLAVAGTPEQVADLIEDWFKAGAADGFNVMPPIIGQQLELFANEVVPLLRKRGLFREEYDSHTLRGHFGLKEVSPLPAADERSQQAAA